MSRIFSAFTFLSCTALLLTGSLVADEPPKVGDEFPAIEAESMDGEDLNSAKMLEEGPLVVSFIRGFPGYQCPLCTRQVASMLKLADDYEAKNAQVVLVYPGDVDSLNDKAAEFFKGMELPKSFKVIVDKDYKLVDSFGLRWNAKNETTYPATFVVQKDGKISYALVSKGHGGRANGEQILKALAE